MEAFSALPSARIMSRALLSVAGSPSLSSDAARALDVGAATCHTYTVVVRTLDICRLHLRMCRHIRMCAMVSCLKQFKNNTHIERARGACL